MTDSFRGAGLRRLFRPWRIFCAFGALAAGGGLWVAADWWLCLPEGQIPQYVGRQSCAECHPKETELWTNSDHDRAMDLATPETVLGDFGDRRVEHFGLTSRMFRREDGTYCITTDNREGKLETFAIKYVLGYRPLQQYLVEFPDGRIQCLPLAWDTIGRRWFHLYPHEPILHTDPLHWTGRLQNWNYMCAECHTTNLQKNYRVEDNTYQTTFSEIDVSCEACHGPGSLHVQLARSWSLFWDRRYGYGLPKLKDPDNRVQIESCAPCHAHRRIVQPNWRAGQPFLDYYMPELLDGPLYHPDGQILEEVYEYGSFLQSRMFQEQVRCTDCHDPHTTRVKFAEPDQRGRFTDNRLCGQCHLPAKYDSVAHHHHPDTSKPGSHCVDCHMPDRYYMVVDPRRDHSLRIPRPDLTVSLGIPNACNGCHHDESKGETAGWAAGWVEKWYGPRKEPPHFAYAFDAARRAQPDALRALEAVIRRRETRPIVRASAVALLGNYVGEEAQSLARAALDDPEPLVRAAAVRVLEQLPDEQLLSHLGRCLSDPVRAVRVEAARILTRVPTSQWPEAQRTAFASALDEYIRSQEAVADQPGAHLNLGVVYGHLEQLQKAEQAYQTALALDPRFVPARINLALLYDKRGDKQEAEKRFRQTIEELQRQLADTRQMAKAAAIRSSDRTAGAPAHSPAEKAPATKSPTPEPARSASSASVSYVPVFAALKPENPQRYWERAIEQLQEQLGGVHYSLGLLLAEDEQRLAEAAEALQSAATLMPSHPRVHYNLGLARQRLKQPEAAEQALVRACRLAPEEPAFVLALAVFYAQQEQWRKALTCAEQLVRIRPGDPEARQLLEWIRQKSKGS